MQPGNWADSPFPLIPTPLGARSYAKEHSAVQMAQDMTHLHNCLLRILNAIYNQACEVKTTTDIQDFLTFVKFWHFELEHHHQTEEECFFPHIERITGKEGIMEGNVDQHHLFEPGLAAILKFATETKVEDYDGLKLRAIIDEFGEILQTHLQDEIHTLLSLRCYDSAKLSEAWAKTHEYVMKTSDSNIQLPLLMRSMDRTYEGQAIGLAFPWFLYYLTELVFQHKHKGALRFLPCTTWGQPKPLAFAPRNIAD